MVMNGHFVIARSDSDEAIQGGKRRPGLQRCAPNDGNGEME
ncbi:hypothetical protein [Parasphingorhabdus sp.]